MEWTHHKPADGRRMPWKNGGGSTLELAVEPPGATLETGFLWRVSTAEVGVSGPFSPFPGLQRWLLLLEGKGFQLDFGPHGQVALTESLRPVCFQGDWPAAATLVDGPCTDLNVMVDPRFIQARVDAFRWSAPHLLDLAGVETLLYVAWGTLAAPALALYLGQGHLLRLKSGRELALAPGFGGAGLVRIGFDPA